MTILSDVAESLIFLAARWLFHRNNDTNFSVSMMLISDSHTGRWIEKSGISIGRISYTDISVHICSSASVLADNQWGVYSVTTVSETRASDSYTTL